MRPEQRAGRVADAPEDSWLAGEGALDWGDPRGRASGASAERASAAEDASWYDGAAEELERWEAAPDTRTEAVRRRRVAALATLGALVVAGVAIAIATAGGGGDATEATDLADAPASTVPVTTPAAATAPTTETAPTATTPAPAVTTPETTPETTPTTTTPTPAPSSDSTTVTLPAAGKLRPGDAGDEVVALQEALALLGLAVGTADGRYGTATRDAVVQFQTDQGLKPDGIVGPLTAEKLNAALAQPG